MVPECLDASIEQAFSLKQQKNRINMFLDITNPNESTPMNEVIIKGAPKVNHGRFHMQYRGSIYRGVSRNGKSWQVLIMIDSEKIYLCTTEDPQLAALLYDIVIIQAKGLSARVNFNYTKRELLGILFTESLLEIKKRKCQQTQLRYEQFFDE